MAAGGVTNNTTIGADFIDTVVVHNILKCLVTMSNEDQGSTIDLRSKNKVASQPERKKMFS